MALPKTPRSVYERNLLKLVICQVRFPAILRVDAEPPAKFQEAIRDRFPLYADRRESLDVELPENIAKLVREHLQPSAGRLIFDFKSEDARWALTLTRESLALSDHRYSRWEQFREHFVAPLAGLEKEYSPAFYSRIGLRYQNLIQRSQLGLEGLDWKDLVAEHIAGELSKFEIRGEVENAVRMLSLRIGNREGCITMHHGLIRIKDTTGKDEECFFIDADFYAEPKTEKNDALQVLDRFHTHAYQLFRWCITDRLHEAMVPKGP